MIRYTHQSSEQDDNLHSLRIEPGYRDLDPITLLAPGHQQYF